MEKITLMHKLYGYGKGLCKDCRHLQTFSKKSNYCKCRLYGITSSVETDWAMRWIACGMKEHDAKDIKPVYHPRVKAPDQIEGQMDIFDFLER